MQVFAVEDLALEARTELEPGLARVLERLVQSFRKPRRRGVQPHFELLVDLELTEPAISMQSATRVKPEAVSLASHR